MGAIVYNTHITDAEWEVMRVVWANDRVTSKKVISVLKEKMDCTQIKRRERRINSITQLDDLIKKSADDRQDLLDKIKKIETEMKSLSQDMENINTINKYREIYKYHKKNPEDKQFAEKYYSELSVYKIAAKEILENYKKLPNTKEILSKLDELQEKKNTLMQEYSLNKEQFSDLVQYRKNYENYYGKEVER